MNSKTLVLITFVGSVFSASSQTGRPLADGRNPAKTWNSKVISFSLPATPIDVPEIVNTDIPGAPKLGKPILITDGEKPVIAKGYGIAAPAFYDMDGDGLKDLIIGEFLSGTEYGKAVGNFLRVYKNTGDNNSPKFGEKFTYANPVIEGLAFNTPLSSAQGCCMGFTPEFIDLNNDGHKDIITGQYNGDVRVYWGGRRGWAAGEVLDQHGFDDSLRSKKYRLSTLDDVQSQFYWLYSTASFGDLDGDGLPDMVTGGYVLRFGRNIGTKDNPRFGKREFLFDAKGDPLTDGLYPQNELDTLRDNKVFRIGGKHFAQLSPTVVDWDGDGVLDILATARYEQPGENAITFFKGVKSTGKGPRFQPGIPLFRGKNGAKEFPGRWLHISVCDWNNDGISDLLVGTMAVTLHDDVFNAYLSWNWEAETGVHKYDLGNMPDLDSRSRQHYIDEYKKHEKLKNIPLEDYVTIRHRGYVYVMLGEKGD